MPCLSCLSRLVTGRFHSSFQFRTSQRILQSSSVTSCRRFFSRLSIIDIPTISLQPEVAFSRNNLQNGKAAYSQLSESLLPRPGKTVETYVSYGMTQKLFEACSAQADYKIPQASQKGAETPKTASGEDLGVGEGWWNDCIAQSEPKTEQSFQPTLDFDLLPTFSTWSQVTFLHMYLLTVRLRALPSRESVLTHSRHLIDHFSHNAEHRMVVLHKLSSRSIRNKYLKDLFLQWRGILAAYDEGLVKGDAVLGAAVWRNLWKASPIGPDGKEELDWTQVAYVVAYIRRVLSELSRVDATDLISVLEGDENHGPPSIFRYSEADKRLVEGRR
ncbi:Ubiquinol-cytochrome C chaperone domain containing protein [Elaphomyces granulatus]